MDPIVIEIYLVPVFLDEVITLIWSELDRRSLWWPPWSRHQEWVGPWRRQRYQFQDWYPIPLPSLSLKSSNNRFISFQGKVNRKIMTKQGLEGRISNEMIRFRLQSNLGAVSLEFKMSQTSVTNFSFQISYWKPLQTLKRGIYDYLGPNLRLPPEQNTPMPSSLVQLIVWLIEFSCGHLQMYPSVPLQWTSFIANSSSGTVPKWDPVVRLPPR